MTNLADTLMVIHFLWAAFMVLGLPLGLILRSPALRWAHLAGMLITAFFAVTGMYCPLTVWEETLRWETDPGFTHEGSFLARHLSGILYPRVDPWVVRGASVAWGFLTLLFMVVKWPGPPLARRQGSRHVRKQ